MIIDLDSIPKYVINIPHRTDRLQSIENEINKFFENKEYHLIEGILGKPSSKYIADAHKKCIQHAKDNNYENILIMEDDTIFQSEKSKEYAIEAFKNLPDDWDILLGCIYYADRLIKYNNHWNKIKNDFCATSFYIVNKKNFDKLLDFNLNMHIDRWMANQGKLKCYVVKDFFCIQQDNILSDNKGEVISYSHYLSNFKVLK